MKPYAGLLLLLGLLGPAIAGAGGTRAPDLLPPSLPTAPPASPSLYWVTLTSQPSSSRLGIALEMRAGPAETGILEARVLEGESPPATAARIHRERWGDRVQSFFRLEHGERCEQQLEFLFHLWRATPVAESSLDPDTASFRRTAIPFMGCSVRDEAGTFSVVIPELRWEAAHSGSGAWMYWNLRVRKPAVVGFLVQNAAGACVRTLPAGLLPPGPVVLLWDGMDDTGRPARSGPYSLIPQGCEIDLGKIHASGRPWS